MAKDKPEKGKPVSDTKHIGKAAKARQRSEELRTTNKKVKGVPVSNTNKPNKPVSSSEVTKAKSSSQPDVKGGPADDVSVRGFFELAKSAVTSALTGDYAGVFTSGSKILSIAFDLFGFSGWGDTADVVKDEEWDKLLSDCEEAKKNVEAENVIGADDDMEVDPKKIDPATILLIIQLVAKLVEWIRKRRNPPVTEESETD